MKPVTLVSNECALLSSARRHSSRRICCNAGNSDLQAERTERDRAIQGCRVSRIFAYDRLRDRPFGCQRSRSVRTTPVQGLLLRFVHFER